MALNFVYLRAFHSVASERSFTRAAQILRVSQSTLSSEVRTLEERCGVRLLDRGQTTLPTPMGMELLKLTREIFRLEEEIESLLLRHRQLEEGKLNVGADGPRHVIPVIHKFSANFPKVSIALRTGNAAKVLNDLLNYEVDVAIVALSKPHSRLHAVPFRTYPLLAFVARDHSWAGRKSVSLRDFHNETLVVREPTSMTRQLLLNALAHAKARPAKLIEMDNREATREAVAFGMGVGVMSATEFPSEDRRTVPLVIEHRALQITEYVACLAKKRRMRAIQEFFRICSEHSEAPD